MSKVSRLSARDILWYLVFFGFAVNYMVRLHINIAIVEMVRTPVRSKHVATSECIVVQHNNDTTQAAHNVTYDKINYENNRFDWNEKQQGWVLGAFFWLHWITQIPGGILARKYGTKLVFGLSNMVSCVLSYLIPPAAYYDYRLLLMVRFLQGIIAGFAWPAMHDMTAKWIPPNERSKFVTAYLGSSVGAALTFPLCGLIIDWLNWESVFHISATIGVVWYIAWWLFVYDSPSQHPRITEQERLYIENSLGQCSTKTQQKTPWLAILKSKPIWMNILAQWGGIWGLFTLMTQAPTYFKYIHGWDIRMTGLLSGIPHVLRVIFAFLFSILGDYLLRSNKMSRTNVRKLATAVCSFGQGIFMIALAFVDCDYLAALLLIALATMVQGAVSTGVLASFVDLSPNFASITLGISNMITVLPGFISPIIVGNLTHNNQTIGQWKTVFLIAAANLIITGFLHLFFSKSDIQDWNSSTPVTQEMVSLKNYDTEKSNKEVV